MEEETAQAILSVLKSIEGEATQNTAEIADRLKALEEMLAKVISLLGVIKLNTGGK